MGKFFCDLVNERLIEDFAKVIDWLLNDNKFEKDIWAKKCSRMYTNDIKNYVLSKNGVWNPDVKTIDVAKNKKHKNIFIEIRKTDEAICKNIIRHIRNGIAHGSTREYRFKKELYIEIIDYAKDGNISGYINIPLEYIIELYKEYTIIKKEKTKG